MSSSAITLPVQHVVFMPSPPPVSHSLVLSPFFNPYPCPSYLSLSLHPFPALHVQTPHFKHFKGLLLLRIQQAIFPSGNSLCQGTKDGSFTVHLRQCNYYQNDAYQNMQIVGLLLPKIRSYIYKIAGYSSSVRRVFFLLFGIFVFLLNFICLKALERIQRSYTVSGVGAIN